MKLKFVIDKKYDMKAAKALSVLRRYTKEDLDSMESIYQGSMKYLKLTQALYQKSWDEINKEFSDYVEKITGYKWAFKEYKCVISVINPGASNWGGSSIILRWWKDNPYFMRRITAHELIIHHYFEIYNRKFKNEGLADEQVWALAEIAAYTLTSLPKEVKKWWPWNTNYFGSYYSNTGYPQLDELRRKLKQPFLKRKRF